MKYVGQLDNMCEGKYYLIYFPEVLSSQLDGSQLHIIRCDTHRDMGQVNCTDYFYRSSHKHDPTPETCNAKELVFVDAYGMGQYYELNESEVLTNIVPEMI